MNNKLIAALVILGMTGISKAADVDFNNGVDIQKAVDQAVQRDMPFPGQPINDYYPGPAPYHVRYSRDCHTFNFGPNGGPMLSELAYLESVEYVQECHYIPDPPPPPNPQPGPHPGPFPGPNGPHGPKAIDVSAVDSKGMQCYERPADTFRRSVQLSMGARQLLPWENDSFEVCMEGPNVDIRPRSTAYSYGITQSGGYDVRYELTPQYKVTTAPDPNGLNVAAFTYANGKFTFNVSERWGNEYAGNKVAIDIELYKDGFLFFNSYKGKKEFVFDTASGGYSMTFAENELDTSKAVSTPEDNMRGPKKYFLKWSFHRIGNVSTGESVGKGSTDKIPV
jgi:hypothetical protein